MGNIGEFEFLLFGITSTTRRFIIGKFVDIDKEFNNGGTGIEATVIEEEISIASVEEVGIRKKNLHEI